MLLVSFADGYTLDMPGIEKQAATYNRGIDSAPYILTSILGSEKVNLIVTRDDGTVFRAGLDVVSAKIEHVIPGGYDDVTITVTATQSAIDEVVNSEDKISSFKNMVDQGKISFETDSWMSDLKLKAVLSSTSVLQFGYDLFF
jgi:hypothetical protein